SLSVVSAADDMQDVQSLYSMCKNQDAPGFGVCLGYISGVTEMLQSMRVHNERHPETAVPFALCDNPTYGAILQAFINWAEKNPQEWHQHRLAGVVMAIHQTWPCKGR